MPTARLTDYRIRSGHVSVASVTSTYAITNFTRQSDMDLATDWLAPKTDGTTVPEPARYLTLADGTRKANGFYTFQWAFSIWTQDMLSYFLSTYISSGESANVTVRAYTDTDADVYLQCTVYRPRYKAGLTPTFGGYKDVILNFVNGVIIT